MATPISQRLAVLLLAGCVLVSEALAQTDSAANEPVDPLATAEVYKDRARELGAKGNLPAAWNAYTKRLDAAEKADMVSQATIAPCGQTYPFQ